MHYGLLNITLTEDARMLDEVDAIGFGTQKKSDLTDSLSSVSSADISKSSSNNISQILQGKATGVYVTSNSGTPGSGAPIRIRRYGSISTDLTPQYVVDGSLLANLRSIRQIHSILKMWKS
jgi:outer membrane receptor for ferrienterochelin and colicin